ncbi:conserved hypothetical protein [Peptoniphilus harei ACS-146-V-Sch2b]|uniref:Uncharacterized protein n=1 Tax=Peptoniphilus harei ACS-146-V-Sch2b TaxID=908338 RepID=E4KZ91_9FIRM|nr:conserved hypothetical protein [Peptoniphilus harei ACS-146-V-Sch2b]
MTNISTQYPAYPISNTFGLRMIFTDIFAPDQVRDEIKKE